MTNDSEFFATVALAIGAPKHFINTSMPDWDVFMDLLKEHVDSFSPTQWQDLTRTGQLFSFALRIHDEYTRWYAAQHVRR